MHLHEVWLLLYNTFALGGTSLLTSPNSLPSTQYHLWYGYIISSLISLYWFPTIFEVNEHPIGNNKSTSYRVGLLACRPSSRFRSLKKEGLMVRDIHDLFLSCPVYLMPCISIFGLFRILRFTSSRVRVHVLVSFVWSMIRPHGP